MNSQLSSADDEAQHETTDSTDSGYSGGHGRTRRDLPLRTVPSIRPVLVWMGVTVVSAVVVAGVILLNQNVFGGARTANLLLNALLALTILAVIRLSIRVFILTRTQYIIDRGHVKRTYSLLMRTWSREVPINRVRSSELRQSRIQHVLGYGTVEINQGLGSIQLENVHSPEQVRKTITDLTKRQDTADAGL
jgi:uncharacterized membrane protein YdbT with pleckstrin-like domain